MEKKQKQFNPKDLLTKKIHVVNDPELGEVKFGDLTIGDSTEISKTETDEEKGLRIVFIALSKAYPDLTFEDVKQFSLQKAARLINIIGVQQGLLTKFEKPSNKVKVKP